MTKSTKKDSMKAKRDQVIASLQERGYTVTADGLQYSGSGGPCLLLAPFKVMGGAETTVGVLDGVVISAKGTDGVKRVAHVPLDALQEPRKLAAIIASIGLNPPIELNRLRLLATFIHERGRLHRCRVLKREGIHEVHIRDQRVPLAVMGSSLFSPTKLRVIATPMGDSVFAQKGSLAGWVEDFAPILPNNPLVAFPILIALAAPFKSLYNLPAPSALYTGESGTGKSTCARAGQSTTGPADELGQWTGSERGLEALAVKHRDALLVLDELGTAATATLGTTIYRLSGGLGTARATPTGDLAQRASIRCSLFATGEVDKDQHSSASGKHMREGHEARMPTIPVGETFGAFSSLPEGCEDGAALSRLIDSATVRNFGVVMPVFVKELIAHHEAIDSKLRRMVGSYRARIKKRTKCGDLNAVEGRVLEGFVTLAIAGRLAVRYAVLPMSKNDVIDTVSCVFRLWLDVWRAGGEGGGNRAVDGARAWFQQFAHSRFVDLAEWSAPGHRDRAGYEFTHRDEKSLFLVHRKVMRDEICKGQNPDEVIKALMKAGLLATPKKGLQWLQRMPGVPKHSEGSRMKFYAVRQSILFDA